MLKRMKCFLAVTLLLLSTVVSAQVTTASMSGKVYSGNEAIIGATVLAVHESSGTRYGIISNMDGRFTIDGMRTGNYNVEVSYIGYTTVKFTGIILRLGDNYILNVEMNESSEVLDEVVVVGTKSKFAAEKTGAVTNISNEQLTLLPTVNRSLSDFTRLSPYSGGNNSFAGRDGRTNTFTIDGANLNNNFGLSSDLPGGGNPVSLDAIEEIQVVIAPFDVRQTNFVGGGINAITKSGTNTFKATAYTYQRNENFRGNKVDGKELPAREKESKSTYGFTLGGPIIKNKLFFFVNGEYEDQPQPVHKYRLSTGNETDEDKKNPYLSRVTAQDMDNFANILKNDYGYNPGSYTNYDGGTSNYKLLGRIDWNINEEHRLSVRYNLTKNSKDIPTNGTSTVGSKASNNRISQSAMAFRDNCYSMDNNVSSLTAELNSRFGNAMSNRFLLTYSDIEDVRSTPSSPFPHIDIWKDGDAFMSAGYELFSWNNRVQNKIFNVQDHFTWTIGSHKLVGGLSFEYQKAINNFMRYGTGYYKYASLDDFKNGAAPIAFGLTYGYDGELSPSAEVSFAQSALFLQDEWNVTNNFKLTYGIRADLMSFLNDLDTNEAYKKLDWKGHFIPQSDPGYASYKAPVIDTGMWPKSKVQFSPRVGFNWDVNGDKTLVVRGGTGVFTGRIPLVFLTNMPTNGMMLQNTVSITSAADLAKLAGKVTTNVSDMIKKLGLPTGSSFSNPDAPVKGAAVVGVADDFKLPQVWKNSLAVDYRLPLSFPATLTVEAMYNKDINAVIQENYNVIHEGDLGRFEGPDNRYNYRTAPSVSVQSNVTSGAIVLKNSSKGYSGSVNVMLNAEPIKNLNLMASYTHMVAKEITGLPGNQAYSSWQNLPSVNSPNLTGLHNSQYLTPNKVIAAVSYRIEYGKGKNFGTNFGLYYSGYNSGLYSYCYNNDMNGDGQGGGYDLIYIPKTKDELIFTDKDDVTAAEQADIFWKFVNQDDYLSSRKGKYAESYGAKMPWVNRIDLKISQDFKVKAGSTMNTLQLSLDVLNVGNLLNDSWGVTKSIASCNNGKILNMERVENGVPVYSTKLTEKSTTFTPVSDTSNCWQLQIGIRYIFN